MKTAIFGSRGFVGRCLLKHLQGSGADTVGFSSGDNSWINPDTGDILPSFSIPKDTEAVVYLAQSPFFQKIPEKSDHVVKVNCLAAVRIAEMARKAKVKRFIYASTGNVYAPSFALLSEDSPLHGEGAYVISKVHAEEMLNFFRDYMDITIIRPFGIYGPGQKNKLVAALIDSIIAGKEIYLERKPNDRSDPDGLKISLCYIDDAVQMIAALINTNGPAFLNIAGNEAISIRDLALMIGKPANKEVKFKLSDTCRKTDLIADISLLKKILNPRFTRIEDGLRKTVGAAVNKS